MDRELFGWVYELVISDPFEVLSNQRNNSDIQSSEGLVSGPINSSKIPNSGTDFTSVQKPEKAILLNDLHFEADILYSKRSGNTNQSTTISIYNLSKSTRDKIAKTSLVLLKAGYEQDRDLPTIFIGQVEKVSTTKKGQDRITKLTCKDATVPFNHLKVSKSYRNVSYFDIIADLTDLASQGGLPTGRITLDSNESGFKKATDILTKGVSVEGRLLVKLEEICDIINYQSYVYLGKLYVQPVSEPRLESIIEVFSSNVKGNIEPEDDSTGVSHNDQRSKPGIKFSTFLNGFMDMGKRILIRDNEEFNGVYEITSIQHKLSYEGSMWDTIVTCKNLK